MSPRSIKKTEIVAGRIIGQMKKREGKGAAAPRVIHVYSRFLCSLLDLGFIGFIDLNVLLYDLMI